MSLILILVLVRQVIKSAATVQRNPREEGAQGLRWTIMDDAAGVRQVHSRRQPRGTFMSASADRSSEWKELRARDGQSQMMQFGPVGPQQTVSSPREPGGLRDTQKERDLVSNLSGT